MNNLCNLPVVLVRVLGVNVFITVKILNLHNRSVYLPCKIPRQVWNENEINKKRVVFFPTCKKFNEVRIW
jgi:cytidine deaminase